MTMRRSALILAAGLLLLTGCTQTQDEPEATLTPSPTEERAEVEWDDYAADVKTRIDAATEAGDCAALQTEFDNADANSDRVMQNTGHNNATLMAYIDEALELAGCYD